MTRLKRLFTEHPTSVGETYFQHLCSAWYFAGQMALGVINCLVHGLLPFVFKQAGSGRIAHLNDCMIANRAHRRADRQRKPASMATEQGL